MSSSSRRGQAWLTPVEIFAPWYSYAVARYILDDFRRRGAGGHGGPERLPCLLCLHCGALHRVGCALAKRPRRVALLLAPSASAGSGLVAALERARVPE